MTEKKLIMTTNKLVIFEGLDRSGKSTLRLELLKKIKNIITVDRLTASNYVYAMFYNREEDFLYLAYLEAVLMTRGIVVYCYTDYKTYKERCKNTEHEILSEKDFIAQQSLYEYYFKNVTLYRNIIKFDTSNMSTESCLNILISYIQKAYLS